LTAIVAMHLREVRHYSTLKGLVFNYASFDVSNYSPSTYTLDPSRPLILGLEHVEHFMDAYLPDKPVGTEARKIPTISPLYGKLEDLGSALFIIGTQDGLLDDTILMSARWQIAGNEAIVKFVPGGCHGFMTFDGNQVPVTRQGWDIMIQYLQSKI